MNMRKRSREEVSSPAEYQRLETPMENLNIYANELKVPKLDLSTIDDKCMTISRDSSTIADSPDVKPDVVINFSTYGNDTTSFENPCQKSISAKDYLSIFFEDMNFENLDCSTTLTSLKDQPFQVPVNNTLQTSVRCEVNELHASSISHASSEIQSTTTPTSVFKSDKLYNSYIFHEELSDCFYLTLKLKNKHYYIYIQEFKRNIITNEEIPTKHWVNMDIPSWYEFQNKIIAFNLRYKSTSFISNNIILALNQNSMMRIKNLKNYSHIDLNEHQLERLKESTFHLNKALLQHMYTKQLPSLIKQKCLVSNVSAENEHILWSKLITCIENNMLTILNRLYECTACALRHASQSLHSCFALNNREKFNQLGDALLMLIDFDYIISTFSNEVYSVSELFLCKIHVETIQNVLFKTIK